MRNWSIDHLQKTWYLISKLHQGQKYGGSEDGFQIEYINHIGSVTFEVLQALQHDETLNGDFSISCALLHDSIEDTPFTFEEIEDLFGEAVAHGVSALTKNTSMENKDDQMIDSLNRIKKQPKEVWSVKMADRICNLYSPPYYWSTEKKKQYHAESLLIYDNLKEGNSYLANRLKDKIDQYVSYF